MEWFAVYSQEVLSAYRAMQNRLRKHPFTAVWFTLLLLFFVGIITGIVNFALQEGDVELLSQLDRNSLVLIVFIIFYAKTTVDTLRRVVANDSFGYYLAQPVRVGRVLFGSAVSQIIFNLSVLALVLGVVVGFMAVFNLTYIPKDEFFVIYSILAVVFASIVGTYFTIILQLRPVTRMVTWFLLLAPLLSSFYLLMDELALTDSMTAFVLLALTFLSLLLLIPASWLVVDAWNFGTHPGHGFLLRAGKGMSRRSFISRFLPESVYLLYAKERIRMLRSREFFGSLVTIGAVAVGTMYAVSWFSDLSADESMRFFMRMNARLFVIPLIIAMGIYSIVLLEHGILSLSIVGREGKGLCLLRSSPVSGRTIVAAKAVSNLYLAPLVVVFVAVPPTLYGGFSVGAAVLAVLGALTMVFLFTGLGVWFGARYPSFDPASKGTPDIMTLYFYAMACLFVTTIFTAVPYGLAILDLPLGLLAMALAADLAVLVLYQGVKAAGRTLDELEVVC